MLVPLLPLEKPPAVDQKLMDQFAGNARTVVYVTADSLADWHNKKEAIEELVHLAFHNQPRCRLAFFIVTE